LPGFRKTSGAFAAKERTRLAHFLFDELTIGLREPPMLLGLVQEPSPHQAGCDCRGQRPQTNRFAFVLLA
jgi:hypothetical protein